MRGLAQMFKNHECVLPDQKHDSTMDRIRVLHSALDFAAIQKQTGKITEMDTDEGSVFIVDLFHSDTIGIIRSIATAGSRLKRHQHDAFETLILYSGAMDLIFDDHTTRMDISRPTYYIEPNIPHAAYFIENTKAVGITIPNAYQG